MPAMRKTAHPWVKQVLVILRDGEWHDFTKVINELAKLVPPGVAYRRGEKYSHGGELKTRTRPKPKEEIIRIGAREEVRVALRGLVGTGRIEYDYRQVGPVKKRPARVRLTERQMKEGPWTIKRGGNVK